MALPFGPLMSLLFSAIVVLALVGFSRPLAFTADWTFLQRLAQCPADPSHPATEWLSPYGATQWTERAGPGRASLVLGVVRAKATLAESAIRGAGEPVTSALRRAAGRLEADDTDGARAALARLDAEDPSVAYGLAVIDTHDTHWIDRLPEMLRRLRRATDAGIVPALALAGTVHFALAYEYRTNSARRPALVTLDGAGNLAPATADEHLREAIAWTRRAATFGAPDAVRNLGMAASLGLDGEPDLNTAAAFWRNAAAAALEEAAD